MRDPDGQLLCTSLLRACCLRECKLAAPAALPGVCALSAGLVPVRVLFGHLKAPSQRSKWKSSDRCNGRDRPQVSQRNAPPPNRAGRRGQVTGCALYACSLYAPVLYHQSSEIGVPVSHTRMRIDQPRKRNQMPPIRIRMPNPPDTIPRTGEIDAVVR